MGSRRWVLTLCTLFKIHINHYMDSEICIASIYDIIDIKNYTHMHILDITEETAPGLDRRGADKTPQQMALKGTIKLIMDTRPSAPSSRMASSTCAPAGSLEV